MKHKQPKMKYRLLTLLIPAIFAVFSCRNNMNPSEMPDWIAAYAPEIIEPDSKIRIEPTDTLRKLIDFEAGLDGVFSFTPRVTGIATFGEGGRFLDFYPHQGELEEGREYECRIDMGRLSGCPELGDFSFKFRVGRREVKMDELIVSIDSRNIENAKVSGKLVFSHAPGDITYDTRMFSCSEKDVQFNISKTDDDKTFDFVASNIRRKENDYSLTIQYKPSESSEGVSHEVNVPGVKEFKLHSAVNVSSSDPYIALEFTAPLDERQSLEGLISIDRCDIIRIERNAASVRVFYDGIGLARFTLNISDVLRSYDGRNLKSEINQEVIQEVIPPAIEVPMDGTILPDGRNLIFPFKAVNLAAVDVEVVKIYADNVLHFLHDNEIGDNDYMRRAGRLIYRKTIRLDKNKSLDLHKWQNFSINLNDLFKQERAAIYNIRLSFRKAYSLYDRNEPEEFKLIDGLTESDRQEWDKTYSYISRTAPDYNWWDYQWSERDDPTKASYYMDSSRMPEYNLLATNLGLIVKQSDNKRVWATVSDIMTTSPLDSVKVTAYNYQLREVGYGWTDSNGFADFNVSGKPFVVTAFDGISTTYLKVGDGKEMSTSHFDVSGKSNTGGIKGYTYGDRGIWRPGDDIHLTLIVEDKQKTLPSNHPVTMELFTPEDVLYDRQVLRKGVNGFYTFCIKTSEDALTGHWNAKFHVGSTVFNHKVHIETITPNRLKVNLDLPEVLNADSQTRVDVNATWLTGVIAKGLETNLEVTLYNNDKPFSGYPEYRFSNPLLNFSQSTYELSDGILDTLGHVSLDCQMPKPENAPGMLQANLVCRVAESGGNESVVSKSVRYSPFKTYVGVDLSEKEYETDKDLVFPVVTVDAAGEKMSGRKLEWKIYRLQKQWWWEGSVELLSRYVKGNSAEIVASGTLVTGDAATEIPFRLDYPSWGNFLLFVKDMESNHATGGTFWVDWPQWRGLSDRHASDGASILSFSMDKSKYEVGETAKVYLPKSTGGRVLISIENGSKVLSRRWVTLSSEKETAYRLSITKAMAPNFYVHATLIQPHSQTLNDMPIRMYGIQGAEVIDKNSILHPLIEVADEILPQKEFSVKVREQNGRPMTYTLAVVDEGLLDINGFRTPNAWRTMNLREALGVKTWDMYNEVIGAYAGKFTSVLSIGGDEALRAAEGKEKRFNPVVKFMGPFTTDGRTKTHKVTLPMYVGSVRVMVVAGQNGAYGSAEKNVSVRSPLMILPTLPRVLSCGDKFKMPVNLFVTKDDLKNVDVSVSVEGPLMINGESSKNMTFAAPGEEILDFALTCDASASGVAKVTVTAVSGSHKASETINVQVRNPHQTIVTSQQKLLDNNEETFVWNKDSEKTTLEISTLPSINFEKVYSFVSNYYHYCTEQLSSRAMFLLYGRKFLSEKSQKEAEQMIREIIKELGTRQLSTGGFRYWSSSDSAHQWASSMVGEVMTEALGQGFAIPSDTYAKWIDYQVAEAKRYTHSTKKAADQQQAYRLYTLALAGKPQFAYMNRLKEAKSISQAAKYRLAAAYLIAGKPSVADEIFEKEAVSTEGGYSTFWSGLRDDAMQLETLVLMGRSDLAIPLAKSIAADFSSHYCSTQEVAFISSAFSRLSRILGASGSSVTVTAGGKSKEYKSDKEVVAIDIPAGHGSVAVRNNGSTPLYVSMINERQPSALETIPAHENGVRLSVKYTDTEGKSVDVTNLKQGDQIYVDIVVNKTDGLDSDSMALTFRVPSGLEIWNERIYNDVTSQTRIDVRDDRVCCYFDINGTQKKSFRIKVRAAYEGSYILPATVVEDMYRADCRANTASSTVTITK